MNPKFISKLNVTTTYTALLLEISAYPRFLRMSFKKQCLPTCDKLILK